MNITLTDAASKQIRAQIAKRGKGMGLRVGFKTVGCSGLAYTYEIADEPLPGEHRFEGQEAALLVDTKTLAILDGSRLDFVTSGLKQSFEFDNPNVSGTCGCGESFNLKSSSKLAAAGGVA
ncbi:MAG: iron-sulfur cluster assembly accessory protein [Burkholderiaceae bacterium]